MKHVISGLIIGGIVAALTAAVVLLWAFINWIVGPVPASVITAGTVLIAIGAMALDYVTERRGT